MEIMPCPFCDSTEVRASIWGHKVRCGKCEAIGPEAASQEEAIKAWNRASLAVRIVKNDMQCLLDKWRLNNVGGE